MSTFGEDLIQSLEEAVAHAQGNGTAILHTPVTPRAVRKQVNLTQAQMASADGHESLRLSEMGAGNATGQRPRRVAPACDRKEPEAVKRALLSREEVSEDVGRVSRKA